LQNFLSVAPQQLILLSRFGSEIMADLFQLADISPVATPQSLAGMRFALCRTPDWSAAEPSTVNALNLGAGRPLARPSFKLHSGRIDKWLLFQLFYGSMVQLSLISNSLLRLQVSPSGTLGLCQEKVAHLSSLTSNITAIKFIPRSLAL
jgi:hypothetical protein